MKKYQLSVIVLVLTFCFSSYTSFANDSLLIWQKLTHDIRCIEFTHDSKFVVTGGEDKNIFFWDVNSGEIVKQFYSPIGVNDIEFTSNDSLMAVGGTEAVDIWDVNNMIIVRSLKFWQSSINSLSFSPDNINLAIAANHFGLCVFSVMTGDTVLHLTEYPFEPNTNQKPPYDKTPFISTVDYSNDGAAILFSHNFSLIYNLINQKFSQKIIGSEGIYSPDNRFLLTLFGSGDPIEGNLKYINIETGEVIKTINMGKNPFDYCFSPDGKYIITATGGSQGSLKLWNINTGNVYYEYENNPVYAFNHVTCSPDGKYISTSRGYLELYRTKWTSTSVGEKGNDLLSITNYFPNPAKTELLVDFTLPLPGHVSISLINEIGVTVTVISSECKDPGSQTITINISNIIPGTYFLKLEQNGISDVKKIVISR